MVQKSHKKIKSKIPALRLKHHKPSSSQSKKTHCS